MRALRPWMYAAVAVFSVSLSACSSGEVTVGAEASPSATRTTTNEATEATTTEAEAADGAPKWASPVKVVGDKISTFKAGDVTVDVYQVGVTKATKSGFFADPKTKKPLLAKGDDIVFVNYVITNEGAPIDLGASLIKVDATYEDWKYLQAMGGISDLALFEEQGVNDDALASGVYIDPSIYTLGTGQSLSYGANFAYQPGSPITFEAEYTPVDAQGELLHDDRVEGEGTGTIA
jgi:hypothetical protein